MAMKYTCPCCGYKTLDGKHEYDICKICFWEDDHYHIKHPYCGGGANHISLYKSQMNYEKYGVSEKAFLKNVRKPTMEDSRDETWLSLPRLRFKEVAEAFRIGLMIGVFKVDDVLKWVDQRIENEMSPEMELIEIAFCSSRGVNDVISKLKGVVGSYDAQIPAKVTLGLLYMDLVTGKRSLDEIRFKLYSLSNVVTKENLDEDIIKELSVMDDYHHLYSQDTMQKIIVDFLAPYENMAEWFLEHIDYEFDQGRDAI